MEESERRRVRQLFHERWGRLGVDGLLPAERDHVLLWELNAEVSSGTFDQYLSNSSGDHAEEAVAALERVGADRVAGILRRVLDAMPGGWSQDRWERCARLQSVPEETIRALTDEYYDAIAAETAVGERLTERIVTAYRAEGLIE